MLNDTVKGRTRKLIVFLNAKVILFSLEEKSGSLTWGLKMFVIVNIAASSTFLYFMLLEATLETWSVCFLESWASHFTFSNGKMMGLD